MNKTPFDIAKDVIAFKNIENLSLFKDFPYQDYLNAGYINPNEQVGVYFKAKELQCKGKGCCSKDTLPTIETILAIDVIRYVLGMPLIVTSGCRCEIHNKRVGGKKGSFHLAREGKRCAVDMKTRDMYRLNDLIQQYYRFKGIGFYKGFTHGDTRKKRARWGGNSYNMTKGRSKV